MGGKTHMPESGRSRAHCDLPCASTSCIKIRTCSTGPTDTSGCTIEYYPRSYTGKDRLVQLYRSPRYLRSNPVRFEPYVVMEGERVSPILSVLGSFKFPGEGGGT